MNKVGTTPQNAGPKRSGPTPDFFPLPTTGMAWYSCKKKNQKKPESKNRASLGYIAMIRAIKIKVL
jgi:hypothetical protein